MSAHSHFLAMTIARVPLALATLGACTIALPAQAQTAGQPEQQNAAEEEQEEILVLGKRLPGAVIGDIPPEVTLSPGDIRSFGVSSVNELLAEIAAQTMSGQGRGGESPVVLLNGQRVSGFAEIRDIPVEAIQRVEILPEEVALKYGYRPNQKVVNIVLRRRFNAITAEGKSSFATEGGRTSPEIEGSYLRIRDSGRLNLAFSYEHASALHESERDIALLTEATPYDSLGNIRSATTGAEIDPALSALLGYPATVIDVPASARTGTPSLADFAGVGSANVTDVRPYRTLLPKTDALQLNATYARALFNGISASFNGTLDYNRSDSQQGFAQTRFTLPAGNPYSPFGSDVQLYRYLPEFGPLDQRSEDVAAHFGALFSGALGSWQWSLTGGYDYSHGRTDTERGYDLTTYAARIAALDPLANPYAPLTPDLADASLADRARSTTNAGTAELVANSALFKLPAGDASTTIKIGATMRDFSATSLRSGTSYDVDLSRDDLLGQISLDLPLASRKEGFLAPLGELSANLNLAYDRLSDFGTLRTYGFGANWTPVKPASLILSYTREEGAPTIQQLGNPQIATDNVRVFDYVRAETVDITRISGGNPALSADDRQLFKAGLTLKPFSKENLSLSLTYTSSRIDNPISSFPNATAAIEAIFPERFTRDASGRLVSIDARPINFSRQDQKLLRWGVNFSKQISSPPRPSAPGAGATSGNQPDLRALMSRGDAAAGQGENRPPTGANSGNAPGERRPGGFAGGPGFGRGPGGRGTRLQLALYHTVHLRETVTIGDNGPRLDLLDGDIISQAGGIPRHEVEAQLGLMHNGFGMRLSADWQSAYTINGGTSGNQALRFSDLATVDFRLFANLGQQQALVKAWPFLRGARITLSANNLFNSRQHVRDAAGDTPISYQPAYLDPLGRSVRIGFRKLFF